MRWTLPVAIFLILLSSIGRSAGNSQSVNLFLKAGSFSISQQSESELSNAIKSDFNPYMILSFNTLPDESKKATMESHGLKIYHYLPDRSFYAYIPADIDTRTLLSWDVHSVTGLAQWMKWHPVLTNEIPDWTVDESGGINLVVSYLGTRKDAELRAALREINAMLLENDYGQQRAFVRIGEKKMSELGSIPWVFFIEPIDPPSFPENYTGRVQHRSNTLAEDYIGGLKYNGSGINIGVQDDGIIGPHIDYQGRIAMQFPTGNSGNHGDHVSGTIMGAGNLNPKGRGMAFGSDLYVYTSDNDSYDSVPNHYSKYDIFIVSKSYSDGCNTGYTSLTRKLDRQIRLYPSLIHVFSAGNNGTSNCGYGAGSSWGNITGGHKMGKNVITVGNLNAYDGLAASSSRGPASDGRIKPDICAKGTNVFSTVAENDYDTYTGTSMSCPGISGSMAQLYQAYRDLNGNQNPPSALMKGIMLNTADDLGNPGPDFKHGWGRVNLKRAYEVLSNNQYISGQAGSSGSNNHNVYVPANVKELRIMVYWHDYEAVASASRAIVNNLDMVVTDPSSNTYLPWVLNPAPNATTLNSNAIRAVDSLNNVEQVSINSPATGNYTVRITSSSVVQAPQTYFVIYSFIYDDITVVYPIGGEGLVPGETELIQWDAFGSSGSFTVEYSINGGGAWSTISNSVSGSTRYLTWAVPNLVTEQALIRVSRGFTSDISDTTFTIISTPLNLHRIWSCPDSMKIGWNAVTGASGYRVYELGQKYMDSVTTTQNLSYVFHSTDITVSHWVSVSANAGQNSTGRRAVAYETPTGMFNCPLNNDAALSGLLSPEPSTYFTCNPPKVNVIIKNDGQNDLHNIPVQCVLDGTIKFQDILGDTIKPGNSAVLHLPYSGNLSNGMHDIRCYTFLPNDPNPYFDTSASISFRIQEGVIVTQPWSEDFENMGRCGTNNNCGSTICRLDDGWLNDSSGVFDDHDWRVDDQGTASGGTGPSEDHNPGTISGNYLYTEASSGCTYMVSNLISPCLDLQDLIVPRLSFWLHMYGQEMGDLHIDVLHDGIWKKDVISSVIGSHGDLWFRDSVTLTAYVGDTVNIRFRGITGSGYRSDMAIDDISFYESAHVVPGLGENRKYTIGFFPNPVADQLTIFWPQNQGSFLRVQLTDLSGRVVRELEIQTENSNAYTINTGDLMPGMYVLRCRLGMQDVSQKIIKL